MGDRIDSSGNMESLRTGCASLAKTIFWLSLVLTGAMLPAAGLAQIVLGSSSEFPIADPRTSDEELEPFSNWDARVYFGTVLESLFSLQVFATNSNWVDSIARPAFHRYPVTLLFFALYFFIAYGLLLSIITSFLEGTIRSEQQRKKLKAMREAEERSRISAEIMGIIQLIDENADGQLSAEELDKALFHEPIRRALHSLGVPLNASGAAIVAMIDQTGDGLINYEEFSRRLGELNNDIVQRDYSKLVMRMNSVHTRAKTFAPRLIRISGYLVEVRTQFDESMKKMRTWMGTQTTKVNFDNARKAANESIPAAPKFKGFEDQKAIENKLSAALERDTDNEARQALQTVQRIVNLQPRESKPSAMRGFINAPNSVAAPMPTGLPGQIVAEDEAEERLKVKDRLRTLAKQPHILSSTPPAYGKAYQIVIEEERKILEEDVLDLNPFSKSSIEGARIFKKDLQDSFGSQLKAVSRPAVHF
jgi:Ca2+-binding EF-hand superfamily protein